ncbi:MAG: rod shape-determining protein MreD [Pseudomonadales bacterium]
MTNNTSLFFMIGISLLVAFWLSIVPMSVSWSLWRPAWVAVVVIYWVLYAPSVVGVFFAWMMGFLLDGFEGAIVGQHALAFAVVAYVTAGAGQRVRHFTLLQQIGFVLLMVTVAQLVSLWVVSFTDRPIQLSLWLSPVPGSALVWLLLLGLARPWIRQSHLV